MENLKREILNWRSFSEARTFVRALGLKNRNEWRAYCKSGRKPTDIPTNPNTIYGSEFKGMGDWLGTGIVGNQNRTFLPFAEVRAFVHQLGLRNVDQWRAYCQSGKKPDNIPSNPNKTYGSEFESMGDWLGTGTIAARDRKYLPFAEARAFVHQLGLKNQGEWRTYCRSGKRPQNIPTNPHRVYKHDYKGMGDWLGTGTIAPRKREYRSFAEARAFVHQLELKNEAEWRAYYKSGKKPMDIPADPSQTYCAEFKGIGDWLGTGAVASQNREFLPFAEARAFARELGLKNQKEWHAYCISSKKPPHIPANPLSTYGSDFKGYGDWLGTGTIASRNRTYRPFAEARAFVQLLRLQDKAEWEVYAKSGKKPSDIPADPHSVYRSDFKGYGDWLGTGTIAPHKRTFLPLAEARAFVHQLGLQNQDEWRTYCASGEKPDDIPSNPGNAYGSEFNSYGDWLGTGTIAARYLQFRPFTEARTFVHQLGLKNQQEWYDYCTEGKKPRDIPRNPQRTYSTEFKGYGDWLGVVNKWTKKALLSLLYDLRPQLRQLEERELYVILQQGGALPKLRIAFGRSSPMRVLKDFKDNDGKELEQALRNIADNKFAVYKDDCMVDEDPVVEEEKLPTLNTTYIFEHEAIPQEHLEDTNRTDMGISLPTLATKESLRVVDLLAHLSCGLDETAAEYLVSNRVSALWESYIHQGRSIVDELLAGDGGYWFIEIRHRFLAEVEGVESLIIPAGWSFSTANGERALPNAMQRRTAWAVREKRRVGNWSGVGAGKTLSAILTSRVIDARVTLVVTNNATVSGWREQITNAYPGSMVYTSVSESTRLSRECYNYLVLNYEKFQGNERNHLVHLLLGLGLDFIVLDEVQFVKQRDAHASNRRKALEAMVCSASEINEDLRVLGMSATPVINNLMEAKKLLEIVMGMQFPELEAIPTVNNALAVHRALMLHGFRYRPRYEQEMHTEIVTTERNDLLESLREAQKSVLCVEQVLLHAKLEALQSYFRKGTIVYAHYVDEIVGPTRSYLEGMGLSVGLYTGNDKSGLDGFLAGRSDILVGTSPVGTGLDGLQRVCSRIVMLCLPWTGAEYEQIIGRIRRQGGAFGEVGIIVPQVILNYEGDTWSWDQGRMACIQFKKTLSDCALDGYLPETVRINQNVLLEQSREALERWIRRIGEEGIISIERQRLTVPLPPDIRHKVQVRHGDFTALNQRWNISRSSTTHKRMQQNPAEWYLYHTLYRETCEKWPEQPFERIAERIRVRPDWVVGDFGCGECLLRQALPNNHIISIDHVAWDEQVIACDMGSTPLEHAALDVAVFSLSLMGTNWTDYLREAYRTLKPYGHLFIAEPYKKWQDRIEELKKAVGAAGFHLLNDVEQRYDFVYLTAIKA